MSWASYTMGSIGGGEDEGGGGGESRLGYLSSLCMCAHMCMNVW